MKGMGGMEGNEKIYEKELEMEIGIWEVLKI